MIRDSFGAILDVGAELEVDGLACKAEIDQWEAEGRGLEWGEVSTLEQASVFVKGHVEPT